MTANYDFLYKILFFVLALMIFIIISNNTSIMDHADDAIFFHALDHKSLSEYIYTRYMGWSGRAAIEAFMVVTIKYKIFWKTAIPGSLFLLCYSIWGLTLKDKVNSYIGISIAICLYFMIPKAVTDNAGRWVTGFYNYQLPVALGLFSVLIFKNRETSNKLLVVLSALCLFISCYNEQMAFCLIVSSLLISISRRKDYKHRKFDVIYIVLIVVNSAVLFLAPGNHTRLILEIGRWLPEFQDYNLLHKLTLGLDRLNQHFREYTNMLMLVTSFTLIIAVLKKKDVWKMKPIVIFLISINLICMLLATYNSPLVSWISTTKYLSVDNWTEYKIFMSYTLCLVTVSAMLCANIYIAENRTELVSLNVYILLALASVFALGFSPTVYASGPRILFMHDILFVTYTCHLIGNVITRDKAYNTQYARLATREFR